jgi:DNA primase
VSVINEVKERLDIVDVISGYVPLKKAGKNHKGLCPFHTEKTPSFVVFPESQRWHCFGCGAGGDVFSFVERFENMEFGEVLRLLAGRAGVELRPRSPAAQAAAQLEDRLGAITAAAAAYYHQLLLKAEEAAQARSYLSRRGISEATLDVFQLGYAREDWQALGNHLTTKGHSWPDLLEAGLVLERQGGGYYDRFRGRVMFPICDVRGQVVGFGARALDGTPPKYLNSPQTPLFDKSGVLYGIHRAKTAIREQGHAVVVEGYMDVLMAHQQGRANVLASLGTAVTEKQIRVVKKLTKKLVLAMDADTAGDQATLRGLLVAKETFDRRAVPVPTWRGLVRYEQQLDAEIRVVTLPAGVDPDEVIRADVTQWDALIARAQPVLEYHIEAVISGYDLKSPKDKMRAAREALPLIMEIQSPVERAHYMQRLARRLRVDERALQRESEGLKSRPVATAEAPAERHGRLSAQPGLTFGLERHALLLLLRDPALLDAMNRALQALELPALAGEDLVGTEERALFEFIRSRIEMGNVLGSESLHEEVDPALRRSLDHMLRLAAEALLPPEDQAAPAAAECSLRLRLLTVLRRIDELRHLLQDAREQGDEDTARQVAGMVNDLAPTLGRIQKAIAELQSRKGSTSETPLD